MLIGKKSNVRFHDWHNVDHERIAKVLAHMDHVWLYAVYVGDRNLRLDDGIMFRIHKRYRDPLYPRTCGIAGHDDVRNGTYCYCHIDQERLARAETLVERIVFWSRIIQSGATLEKQNMLRARICHAMNVLRSLHNDVETQQAA